LSATVATTEQPLRIGGARLASAGLGAIVFLSGFVMIEPSPYDVSLIAAAAVWVAGGLKLNRYMLPLAVLMLFYLAGGLIALTQMPAITARAANYMITTGYLVVSAIFFAAVVSADPERRLPVIRRAYVAAAVVVALIAILAYFNAIPHADLFKLYSRAKGTFKDPNVFGPFLALPVAFLFQDIITRPLRRTLWQAAALLVILFGVLLSFSRAAWGLVAFEMIAVAYLVFINEQSRMARMKLIGALAGGMVAIALLAAAAISIPKVHDLFDIRAHVVQSYDDGRAGRFERQKAGFFLMQEKPLGLGPLVFAKMYGEDEHEMWLKGFTTYGWLGGFSYIILALWTLAAGWPLLFRPRPWQAFVQCAYVALLGHVFIHNVIDNDHWRHVYLIYGVLWGVIAAEKLAARRLRQSEAPLVAEPPPAIERAWQRPKIERAQPARPAIERGPKPIAV